MLPQARGFGSHAYAGVEQLADHSGAFLDFGGDGGKHALPNARRGQKKRGPDVTHFLRKLRQAFREPHARAFAQRQKFHYDALRDMLEPEEIERLMARQIIEIAPLAYMRGRTLGNAFVILDEAQNTTTEQMFMLLTRMGPRSKCVVTGDVTQVDLPPNKRSGLVEALQALKTTLGIAVVYFTERDVVRHELVRAIINAYQRHRSPNDSNST